MTNNITTVIKICRNWKSKNCEFKNLLKVSISWNMKQKIYEILTSPKIQTKGVILNNYIDYIDCFLTDFCARPLSSAQLTYLVCSYFSGQKNKFVHLFFGRSFGMTILFRDLLTFKALHLSLSPFLPNNQGRIARQSNLR